jgi:hypothetical protein
MSVPSPAPEPAASPTAHPDDTLNIVAPDHQQRRQRDIHHRKRPCRHHTRPPLIPLDQARLHDPRDFQSRRKTSESRAGASAFNFAHGVSTSDLDTDPACYENNPEIGGTWYENKYSEYACDIPSVNYQLSWAPAVCSAYFSTVPRSWHISIRWQKSTLCAKMFA